MTLLKEDELVPYSEVSLHPSDTFSRGMVKQYYDLNIAEQLCR